MPQYRISFLADLARQMEFAPRDTRAAQVQAAEDLLHGLDPNKAYPSELVVHKVTGYRPKDYTEDLYAGQALQHDLGLLIEAVSDTLDVRTDRTDEPVLTIEDVTARFNVTSKTIQRWRRRGLPARRFIFADGKRRVGFLLGSVERFFSEHQDQVTRGMNFSQVGEAEKAAILRRARRLAVMCQCCVREICRRVAKTLNRSPLTVQHIIRKHDQEHPDQAVFRLAPAPVSDEERTVILRGYRRGLALRSLAKRACRPRSAVYRVILEERVAKLNRRKVKFVDDPLYHAEDAPAQVDAIVSAARQSLGSADGRAEENRVPRDLPAYLQELYRTPLLTPALERALFLKFHYHKGQFVTARRLLEPQFARGRDIDVLEDHLRQATDVKNQIVRANLRLVVSIARKHLRPNLNLMELVSDGNLTLLRAVESFDVHKGNKFSTYATLALMKGFARSVPQMLAGRRATGTVAADVDRLAEVPDGRLGSVADRFTAREEVGRLLGHLTDRERTVVLAQYGLDARYVLDARDGLSTHDGSARDVAAASEPLADRLGVTPQQLRQIERAAIAKLRTAIGVAGLVAR